jgi:hypothetical protein
MLTFESTVFKARQVFSNEANMIRLKSLLTIDLKNLLVILFTYN